MTITSVSTTLDSPVTPVDQPHPGPASADSGPPRQRNRWAKLVRGGVNDPKWARPLLLALLILTAAAYLWDLSISGSANEFYAAAIKSGTVNWRAWLFGSLDSANSITVDKPPASMWVMVLSARILGFSSFSMLLPQALMGVGTVALLYSAVKRTSGHAAGLSAGAILALTPVAALMFRFNNPDAMLVLLMTLGAYCVIRSIETLAPERKSHALRWLLLAGTAIGFAFLTKMLQGLLVLPAFGLVYLVAAPNRLTTRIWHLLAALGAVIVSAGWFVALVAVWPAASRPYIGGSTDNSLWQLAIGYNGLGRLFGNTSSGGSAGSGPTGGPGGGPGGGTGFGGSTGLLRMFGTAFGSQISWLIPAAVVAFITGMWCTRQAPRTDRTRAGVLMWGGWMIVTALVLSFMQGTVHPYYAVALAPGIAGLVAIAGRELWRSRDSHLARTSLALMLALTAGWTYYLLHRDAVTFLPWLRWVVLIGGFVGAATVAASVGRLKKYAMIGLLVGSIAAIGGAAAFTIDTITTAHTGSIPMAGPVSSGIGMGGSRRTDGFGRGRARPTGAMPTSNGTPPNGTPPNGTTSRSTNGAFGGTAAIDPALVTLLNNTQSRWSAAVIGDQTASGYILSTNTAVMAVGGWNGGDSSPTLEQFQAYVAAGDIRYFISGGNSGGNPGGNPGGGSGRNSSTSSSIAVTSWVTSHFPASTVGGATVYDLTKPTTT